MTRHRFDCMSEADSSIGAICTALARNCPLPPSCMHVSRSALGNVRSFPTSGSDGPCRTRTFRAVSRAPHVRQVNFEHIEGVVAPWLYHRPLHEIKSSRLEAISRDAA